MATILVAEDEKAIRSLISIALTAAGHEVLTAVNGLEAATLFRSFPASVDLVITDLQMPVMDGYELVRLIQQDRPGAKIICMTGYAERGCPPGTTVLQKPFLPSQIRELVEQHLSPPDHARARNQH